MKTCSLKLLLKQWGILPAFSLSWIWQKNKTSKWNFQKPGTILLSRPVGQSQSWIPLQSPSLDPKTVSQLFGYDGRYNFAIGSITAKLVFPHHSEKHLVPWLELRNHQAHGQRDGCYFTKTFPFWEDAGTLNLLHGHEDAAGGRERKRKEDRSDEGGRGRERGNKKGTKAWRENERQWGIKECSKAKWKRK